MYILIGKCNKTKLMHGEILGKYKYIYTYIYRCINSLDMLYRCIGYMVYVCVHR